MGPKNCISFRIHNTWIPSCPCPKDRSWSRGRAPKSLSFSTRHILGLICNSGVRKRGKKKEKCRRNYEISGCFNAEGVNEKYQTQIHWPKEEFTRGFCIAYKMTFFFFAQTLVADQCGLARQKSQRIFSLFLNKYLVSLKLIVLDCRR